MSKPQYTTKVAGDESQVPAGYRRVSEMFAEDRPAQVLISKAHKDGHVPAIKIMRNINDVSGPVFVDEKAALEFIREYRNPKEERPSSSALKPALSDRIVAEVEEMNRRQAEISDKLSLLIGAFEKLAEAWAK